MKDIPKDCDHCKFVRTEFLVIPTRPILIRKVQTCDFHHKAITNESGNPLPQERDCEYWESPIPSWLERHKFIASNLLPFTIGVLMVLSSWIVI